MSSQLIDLSHQVEAGMVTYPGLPGPEISDYLSRAASHERYQGQAEFQIARIDMVANTGTYLDAPFHRFPDGRDVGQLPLATVANLPGIVIALPNGKRALEAADLAPFDLSGRAVLVHTGWSRHWRTPAYGDGDHPYVSRDAAQHLADAGAALVGIDSVNIDSTADSSRPAHTILLSHDIPVVEHLTNLEALAQRPFRFFAVPPPIRGVGTFAIRAFGVL